MNPASVEKVKLAVASGNNAAWTWEKLAEEVFTAEGLPGLGDRAKEAAEHAGRVCRGFYPNRAKLWEQTFTTATEEARNLEYKHIIELMTYEANFTIAHRPIPPKPEPKPEPPKAPPPPPAPGAGPAAPPAPPAPPPPPPAG